MKTFVRMLLAAVALSATQIATCGAAEPIRQRKLQAGVEQGCRLSRSGSADDDVPRKVVQAVARLTLLVFQRADGLFEPLAQLGDFSGHAGKARCGGGDHRSQRAARPHQSSPCGFSPMTQPEAEDFAESLGQNFDPSEGLTRSHVPSSSP